MEWENVKPIFRLELERIHMGVMKVDRDKCNGCGLCNDNCPAKNWVIDDNGIAKMKDDILGCISCYQCMAACREDAISPEKTFYVDGGFWGTEPYPLPARMPLKAKDAEGNPEEWNPIERAIFERRSVRNFQDKPVPESLIRRVLEAGRFAPSAGNCQPAKFVVITDKKMIKEIEEGIIGAAGELLTTYLDEEKVKNVLVPEYEANPMPGLYDLRFMLGGVSAIVQRTLPVFLNAPVVILIACDKRAIMGPDLAAGICGQNMNIVANSLGIRACWLGFALLIEKIPSLKEKLGVKPPFTIISAMVLGYPRFKQDGIVPREYRPVTWFREGSEGPELLQGPEE
jgi:nitroreductase/NAD-dependent dihydropyrimidine dehydrogenase PreA subunit